MQGYLVRRLFLFIPTLIIASLVVFGVMNVIPGDVALAILASDDSGVGFTEEDVKNLRAELGLDQPIPVQYGEWAWSMLRGEFGGESLQSGEPIREMVARRFPVTVQLALLTLGITLLISLPLGVIAALYQDRWQDYVIRSATILGLAMPNFWVALLVLLGLVLFFTWSPPIIYENFWDSPSTNFQIMIWPAVVLAWGASSFLARVTRAQVLEVLRQDYIRTARSKGLGESTVIVRHVMRNSLIPVITVLGGYLDAQLSGTVILENIFGVPGIGQGIVDGANFRDWPVITSLGMILVLITLAINLLVDLVYVAIDPRISYK